MKGAKSPLFYISSIAIMTSPKIMPARRLALFDVERDDTSNQLLSPSSNVIGDTKSSGLMASKSHFK